MFVTSEKELGCALKAKPETITIEGEELVKKVVKIKSINKFAWGVCLGGLTVAVAAALISPVVPPLVIVKAAVAPTVICILGFKATAAAILIAVGGGGVAVLTSLRGYAISERNNNRMVLKRK